MDLIIRSEGQENPYARPANGSVYSLGLTSKVILEKISDDASCCDRVTPNSIPKKGEMDVKTTTQTGWFFMMRIICVNNSFP